MEEIGPYTFSDQEHAKFPKVCWQSESPNKNWNCRNQTAEKACISNSSSQCRVAHFTLPFRTVYHFFHRYTSCSTKWPNFRSIKVIFCSGQPFTVTRYCNHWRSFKRHFWCSGKESTCQFNVSR